MDQGLNLLQQTHWKQLWHAYGFATDTPLHLKALLATDKKAREAAIDHLFSAIIHQGTPWSATAPVALVLVEFLKDPRLEQSSIRLSILTFLATLAEIIKDHIGEKEHFEEMAGYPVDPEILQSRNFDVMFEEIDVANALYGQSILDCLKVAPNLVEPFVTELANQDEEIRMQAIFGIAALAQAGTLKEKGTELKDILINRAQSAQSIDERSCLVLALGDMGVSPTVFLQDSSKAVRMCAALAPSLKDDESATLILLQTLEDDANQIDTWFVKKPPQFPMRPRFQVVAALIERVKNFDRLAPAAIALAKITTKECVDFDWGPLLGVAFSEGKGLVTTSAQRQFLQALVSNNNIWDPHWGNARKWFLQAGLPYHQEACRSLIRSS